MGRVRAGWGSGEGLAQGRTREEGWNRLQNLFILGFLLPFLFGNHTVALKDTSPEDPRGVQGREEATGGPCVPPRSHHALRPSDKTKAPSMESPQRQAPHYQPETTDYGLSGLRGSQEPAKVRKK